MANLLSYALTTVDDVKETLGIDSGNTSRDNLIIRKINQATEMIEKYCQRRFASTTYTDIEYSGSGIDQLVLKQRPVTSLTSFQVRTTPENDDDWDDVDADLYFLDSAAGIIDLLFTQNKNWFGYRVSYVAGYTTIPSDLAEACVILAAYMVDNAGSGGGVKRKREGQREIEYFPVASAAGGGSDSLITQLSLDDILAPYVKYTI